MEEELTQRLQHDLEAIKNVGVLKGSEGVNRIAYTLSEDQAHGFIAAEALDMGLQVRRDEVGNSYFVLPGRRFKQKIAFGSHLDSVPNGGNYDGGLGVVMGLEAMRILKDAGINHTLELVVWRCEESARFNSGCLGSKLATGYLDFEDVKKLKDKDGVSLEEAMRASLLHSPGSIETLQKEDYVSYIEPHIEQGDVLARNGHAVGIVTGIRAPVRFKVSITGEGNHSGATPMIYRHDALVAASRMINGIYELALSAEKNGSQTVATVGNIYVADGAVNKIPGYVEFILDIRGTTVEARDRLETVVLDDLLFHARRTGTKVKFSEVERGVPAKLYERDVVVVEEAAKVLGIPTIRLPSGAGHDAQYVWNMGIPTSMIFVRNYGGSHNPQEDINLEDVVAGTRLLIETIKGIDASPRGE
ncbi:MAG TPA: M20 family metallo-hydrolase [Candidatus Nanoarchaeia archaeon]|nr:M20 family metallo-hydrolase [Candidatus Nanoarchaeia archaeon]